MSEAARAPEGVDLWLDKFRRVWPGLVLTPEVRRAAISLTVDERERALRWAEFAGKGKRRPDAGSWLRERRFERIARRMTEAAKEQGRDRPLVFVQRGTRAWEAWVAKGHRDSLHHSRHGGKSGWWFPALWPAGREPEDAA